MVERTEDGVIGVKEIYGMVKVPLTEYLDIILGHKLYHIYGVSYGLVPNYAGYQITVHTTDGNYSINFTGTFSGLGLTQDQDTAIRKVFSRLRKEVKDYWEERYELLKIRQGELNWEFSLNSKEEI